MLWICQSEFISLPPHIHLPQRQQFVVQFHGRQSFGHQVQVFRFDKAGKEVGKDLKLFVMQFMNKCLTAL